MSKIVRFGWLFVCGLTLGAVISLEAHDDRLDHLERELSQTERQLRTLDRVRWENVTTMSEMADVISVLSEVCVSDGKCEAVDK